MTNANQPRAYVVHLSERDKVTEFLDTFEDVEGAPENVIEWSDSIHNAQPLDLDALRLVLEAASNEREHLDETANDARTMGDTEARAACDALGDAIARLSSII